MYTHQNGVGCKQVPKLADSDPAASKQLQLSRDGYSDALRTRIETDRHLAWAIINYKLNLTPVPSISHVADINAVCVQQSCYTWTDLEMDT